VRDLVAELGQQVSDELAADRPHHRKAAEISEAHAGRTGAYLPREDLGRVEPRPSQFEEWHRGRRSAKHCEEKTPSQSIKG
jgi:hypothetical protein